MKIAKFKIFKFALPLVRPLIIGKTVLRKRKGLIVAIYDENGHRGLGEISPLPGLSVEDTKKAKKELLNLRKSVLFSTIPDGLKALTGGFNRWLDSYELSPSVVFGFESALLNLLAHKENKELCGLISNEPKDIIFINALLMGHQDAILKKAKKLIQNDWRSFKLKIGRDLIEDDITRVEKIKEIIKEGISLRLDANRAFTIEKALAFAEKLGKDKIDYIEEPVKNLSMLKELSLKNKMSLPLALDESLKEISPKDLPLFKGIKSIVIKPTTLGFERAIQLARKAQSLGIDPVISSSFESGLGIKILAQMAAAINKSDIPTGLDTINWFEKDLLVDPLQFNRGRLQVTDLNLSWKTLRQDLLIKVI